MCVVNSVSLPTLVIFNFSSTSSNSEFCPFHIFDFRSRKFYDSIMKLFLSLALICTVSLLTLTQAQIKEIQDAGESSSILISTRPLTTDPIHPSNVLVHPTTNVSLIFNYLSNFWAIKWVIFIKNKGFVLFISNYQNTVLLFPCKKCDTDFIMSYPQKFGLVRK